jgi:hypothetical protein
MTLQLLHSEFPHICTRKIWHSFLSVQRHPKFIIYVVWHYRYCFYMEKGGQDREKWCLCNGQALYRNTQSKPSTWYPNYSTLRAVKRSPGFRECQGWKKTMWTWWIRVLKLSKTIIRIKWAHGKKAKKKTVSLEIIYPSNKCRKKPEYIE